MTGYLSHKSHGLRDGLNRGPATAVMACFMAGGVSLGRNEDAGLRRNEDAGLGRVGASAGGPTAGAFAYTVAGIETDATISPIRRVERLADPRPETSRALDSSLQFVSSSRGSLFFATRLSSP